MPAPVQITAEQLLREAKERELELVPPVSKFDEILLDIGCLLVMNVVNKSLFLQSLNVNIMVQIRSSELFCSGHFTY